MTEIKAPSLEKRVALLISEFSHRTNSDHIARAVISVCMEEAARVVRTDKLLMLDINNRLEISNAIRKLGERP